MILVISLEPIEIERCRYLILKIKTNHFVLLVAESCLIPSLCWEKETNQSSVGCGEMRMDGGASSSRLFSLLATGNICLREDQ